MAGTRMHRFALATAFIMLAATSAGCSTPQSVRRDRTLDLSLSEYRIDPQSVRARSGVLLIVVRNYGHRAHNLVLTLNGQAIGSTEPLLPGESSKLKLSLPSGTYIMASTILSDRALGEYGTLVVR